MIAWGLLAFFLHQCECRLRDQAVQYAAWKKSVKREIAVDSELLRFAGQAAETKASTEGVTYVSVYQYVALNCTNLATISVTATNLCQQIEPNPNVLDDSMDYLSMQYFFTTIDNLGYLYQYFYTDSACQDIGIYGIVEGGYVSDVCVNEIGLGVSFMYTDADSFPSYPSADGAYSEYALA